MRNFLLLAFFSGISLSTYAQADSLMSMLNDNTTPKKEPVIATFKATRIINNSSVQNLAAGTLDFRISHRFGRLDEGTSNFLGLDNATTRLGLDYGITEWLMVGIGHSTLNKVNDGFLKARLLSQKVHGTPFTLSYFGSIAINGDAAPALPDGQKYFFSNRMAYVNEILVARKFNDRISLQLMPSLVHFNLVDSSKNSNNTFALGVGGRVKISNRMAITGEYFYRLTNSDMLFNGVPTYNSLSIGLDIETGGHVFQLMFTNSAAMTEKGFIAQTTDSWGKGAIHFGFNISRVFTIIKPAEYRNSNKNW